MTRPDTRSQWMSLPADIADALARYHKEQGLPSEGDTIRKLVAIGLHELDTTTTKESKLP